MGGVGCVEAGVVDVFGHVEMGVIVMVEAVMVVEGSRGSSCCQVACVYVKFTYSKKQLTN